MTPFQNYVQHLRPPFKLAAVTENRNFSHCILLLYYMTKRVQILTAGTWQW
jgi:hypothetical protein